MDETKLALASRELSKCFLNIAKILEGKEKKKKLIKSDNPMDLQAFFDKCSQDKQRHIRLLADWAKEKKPNCKTEEQWRQFITNNVVDAADLSKFTDEQIQEGYKALKKEDYERYTMRTLIKMIVK